MDIIERLKSHYERNPPRSSYGGSEGEGMRGTVYHKWPEGEDSKTLGGVVVWQGDIAASSGALPPDGYCVVDVCLDPSGYETPDAFPLWPEMEGHALRVVIYVDMFNRIHAKAVGGFSSYKKREIQELNKMKSS